MHLHILNANNENHLIEVGRQNGYVSHARVNIIQNKGMMGINCLCVLQVDFKAITKPSDS